jgi:hypothetical protein
MNRILFLSPDFYNYFLLIEKEFIRQGYGVRTVIYPYSKKYKAYCFFNGFEKQRLQYELRYFNSNVDFSKDRYDYIVCIKPSVIPKEILVKLRGQNPSAKFIAYLWDDINNDLKVKEYLQYFNEVFSYSLYDCEQYGFRFRPMFYDNSNLLETKDKDIDIFYIGSYRTDRFDFACSLLKSNKFRHLNIKIILRCSILLFLSTFKHFKYWHIFKTQGVPYQKMLEYMCHSRCAIELPYRQTGMTTRPIEALITKTKIVTTNPLIKSYNLYHPDNFLIVNPDNIEIPLEWLSKPFVRPSDEVLNLYSIRQFVKDLISR